MTVEFSHHGEQSAFVESARRRLEVAKAAARIAGRYLCEQYQSGATLELTYKGEINIVTACDQEAQRLIVQALQVNYADDAIFGEEGPEHDAASLHSGGWVVDPLDGTTNFVRHLPHFCVSIAYHVRGEVLLGVVFAPVLNELYWAYRSGGAFHNESPIHVAETTVLKDAVVASGFPYDLRDQDHDNLKEWAALTRRVRSPRCLGAAALDLCYAACGRYDAYWELDLEPWDMAAGSLIVTEAGGKVTTTQGTPFTLSERSIVASNPRLHREVLAALLEAQGSF